MTTVEKLNAIVNNEKVGNCFFNLYDRWRDESEYEDINQYGDVIIKTINDQFPQFGTSLVSSTRIKRSIHLTFINKKYLVLSFICRTFASELETNNSNKQLKTK